jgi:hypothetical protein
MCPEWKMSEQMIRDYICSPTAEGLIGWKKPAWSLKPRRLLSQ